MLREKGKNKKTEVCCLWKGQSGPTLFALTARKDGVTKIESRMLRKGKNRETEGVLPLERTERQGGLQASTLVMI